MEPFLQQALEDASLGFSIGMMIFGYVVIAIFVRPVFWQGPRREERAATTAACILWPLSFLFVLLGLALLPFFPEERR